MSLLSLRFVILGLSATSSGAQEHAVTYRNLVRGLTALGHQVLFLERDVPWFGHQRDLRPAPGVQTLFYHSLSELQDRFRTDVRQADVVIVGSHLPDGAAIGEWVIKTARGVTAFYDQDTTTTLARLAHGELSYITPKLISQYDIYLSRTGGCGLWQLARQYHPRRAHPLYSCVDPDRYYQTDVLPDWDLGYVGDYNVNRQPSVDELFLAPAHAWPEGHFRLIGRHYPDDIDWPDNVARVERFRSGDECTLYQAQRFTLYLNPATGVATGEPVGASLFEAAACGVPIITTYWPGLESLFNPNSEILIAHSAADIRHYLRNMSRPERLAIGTRAAARVAARHTVQRRALELEQVISPYLARRSTRRVVVAKPMRERQSTSIARA